MPRRAATLLTIAVGLLCVLPLLLLVLLALGRDWSFPLVIPRGLALERLRSFLGGDPALSGALLRSIGLGVAVAAFSTAVGFPAAKFVAYHRWRSQLLLLAYIPFVVSPVVLGASLLFVFLQLQLAGSIVGVAVAHGLFAFGFAIVFFQGFWTAERRAQEELVHTLGGTTAQVYRRVFWPLSREALLICFFQTFLLSWTQYGLTLVIGGGTVESLSTKVFDYLGEANVHYAALASCLLIAPPLLLAWLNKRILLQLA